MGIEGLPFERGDRETERFSGFTFSLSRLQGGFSQIEGHQTGVDMGIECVERAGLAIGESGKLASIAEDKFDLEPRRVALIDRHGVTVDIGGEQALPAFAFQRFD